MCDNTIIDSNVDNLIKELNTQKTSLQKDINRLIKEKDKIQETINSLIELREPVVAEIINDNIHNDNRPFKSRFTKESSISDELCDFLNMPKGIKMKRTDVTRMINKYIIENELNDTESRRIIHPNDKLRELLLVSDDDQLTYFNIQKHLSRHFI
jgi:chromatin remodeling complex protein RSC6